jgi:hypothetical protein
MQRGIRLSRPDATCSNGRKVCFLLKHTVVIPAEQMLTTCICWLQMWVERGSGGRHAASLQLRASPGVHLVCLRTVHALGVFAHRAW